MLGSSVPGAAVQRAQKALVLSKSSWPAGDRTVTLAMPFQEHVPRSGPCGRRERESRREGRREQSLRDLPSRVVAVKGIPVFWKAALFAELRRNEGLGRSVSG